MGSDEDTKPRLPRQYSTISQMHESDDTNSEQSNFYSMHPNVPDHVLDCISESRNSEEYMNDLPSIGSPDSKLDYDLVLDSNSNLSLQKNMTSGDTMKTSAKSGVSQTLSGDDIEWFQMNSRSLILQKVQNLVQLFQERAEKVKEQIAQPPTPTPTPPPSSGGLCKKDEEIHGSRPRLQSLILQQDDEDGNKGIFRNSKSIDIKCCKLPRDCLPSFPKVLDPQSKLYMFWLFFVMLSYVYNAWVIVLRAVFPYQTPENLPIFLCFDYAADIIYLMDMAIFKVRLQFLHDGFWVDDPEMTRKHYFKKIMFKMDVLSLLPLDLLYFVYGINPLFRLPRLLKTQTFWEFFHRVDAVAKTPYVIRIIRTLLYMMYLVHLNACAYYAMSTWEGIGTNGWVFQGEGNAYIRCFYFATKTATSIGKNPKPENEYEYVFMTVSWLMGVFIFAFLIGQIRDIVATATQSRTQYRQLMDHTVMYMRNLSLPDDLQRRVRLWLNHTWDQQKTLNEGGILDSLPRKMKTDVAINVHYNTLVKVQLFKDCDKALLRDLVLQLKPVLFLPGDYICRKGEVGKEMYIVNKGLVQVTDGDKGEIVLATLSEGSVFGEISLLGITGCSRRTADVRSQGFSNLFVLSKDDLWEALKNYPEAQKVLRKKAKLLIKENEERDKATKGNIDLASSQVIISHEVERPSTPQLVRAVIQVVPKDSKCAQMLLGRSPLLHHDMLPSVEKTSPRYTKCYSNPINDNLPLEEHDTTTSALSFQQCAQGQQESKHRRSKSATHKFRNLECLEVHHQEEQLAKDDTLAILETIRNLLPTDFYKKKVNTVHPEHTTPCQEDVSNPMANASEDSGISLDTKRRLQTRKSDDDFYSTEESEDSSELSTLSNRRTVVDVADFSGTAQRKMDEQVITCSSGSLRSLFRSNSGGNKSTHVSLTRRHSNQPSSNTSSSVSAGFDMSYVPIDLLSRRSSIFSDTSC